MGFESGVKRMIKYVHKLKKKRNVSKDNFSLSVSGFKHRKWIIESDSSES